MELETVRTQLNDRLREIVEMNAGVREAIREKDPAGNWSYEDLGVEGEFDDVLESLSDRSRTELLEIWHALQRIDQGRYGLCTSCGRSIDAERLEALPATEYCVECASRIERA